MLENISKETLTYCFIYYILYSFIGAYYMITYVRECKAANYPIFNNSIPKGFFMLIVCGLFTKIVLFIGIISTFIDIFKKKI
jgi:hypothetical protein